MEQFIKELKKNPEQDREKLAMKTFNFPEEELKSLLFFGMFNINRKIDPLEHQLKQMHKLQLESFIKNELESLQKNFPTNYQITFELFVLDEDDDFVKDKLSGVSAFTDWDGKMCFVVYPDEKVRLALKSVITHEFNHHWRISKLAMKEGNETLLDRMILEGLAEHFVKHVLGESFQGPYKDALTEQEAKTLWNQTYHIHAFEKGGITDPFLFGDSEQGLPFWGGYSIGYYLVKWYLEKNRSISFEELMLLPSEEFIEYCSRA
ncbi:hypothetical protein CFK37_18645 [Virgibacillus phasianinus]|uniref:DUF2268 domain-containing protein n=2 Tax=Virgibacillus phasianinus TaxID=2017483 RepID=A0A220U849_9BACI|nr:hypothetical protein CFK37_18645 [Virgibacillus phasianinus]